MLIKNFNVPSLTLAPTTICRTSSLVHWLPSSRPCGRLRSTGHVNVTLAAAADSRESVEVDEVLVLAVEGSRESAGFASLRRDWGWAD